MGKFDLGDTPPSLEDLYKMLAFTIEQLGGSIVLDEVDIVRVNKYDTTQLVIETYQDPWQLRITWKGN